MINKKKYFIVFFFMFVQSMISQQQEKIIIEATEIKEEVPYYKTFRLKGKNPFLEPRTILGKILFENGEECHFYFELKELEEKEIIKHCRVEKKRNPYTIQIEKTFNFIIED